MKILLVNKFLYPRGGSETYVLNLGKLLRAQGHEVEYFGMEDPRNVGGNRINALVSSMELGRGALGRLGAPFRVIYSCQARKKLRRVLEDFQPDVVHLNNIYYHLTPSVILEAHAFRRRTGKRMKIILTAHDYQLVCPGYKLLDGQGRICEKCLGGNYLHCAANRCVKHSLAGSLLAGAEGYFWRRIPAYEKLDRIICCSEFMKTRLDTQERFRDKTVAICNFTDLTPEITVEKGDYVLYFGRFSREKGIATLLDAAERMPETTFLLAGDPQGIGPVPENVRLVGFQKGDALYDLIRRAKVTVCPSEWYENCPYAVLESIALGTPVVASRMGGIPELIRDGENGSLFRAGDPRDLEAKLREVLENPWLLQKYTENCFRFKLETGDSYYEKLMVIYGEEGRLWQEN